MAQNIGYASKYTGELDKVIAQESKSGIFENNGWKPKFSGTKKVFVPDVKFSGLGGYGRVTGGSGYSKGETNLKFTEYELKQTRSRQLNIDALDIDETGIDGLVGKFMKEFIRTEITPEVDAYTMSKLWSIADTETHDKAFTAGTALKDLLTQINACKAANAYATGKYVALVDNEMMTLLQSDHGISRQLMVSDFKKGEVNFEIYELNGVKIIPVSDERMKTSYTFDAGATPEAGGFEPAPDAQSIKALILPVEYANLVKKVVKTDVFSPEEVQDAYAYKINFLMHYDLIVTENKKGTIFSISTTA